MNKFSDDRLVNIFVFVSNQYGNTICIRDFYLIDLVWCPLSRKNLGPLVFYRLWVFLGPVTHDLSYYIAGAMVGRVAAGGLGRGRGDGRG